MLRKLAIVVLARFFSAHFILQSVFAVLVMFASVLVTAAARPFTQPKYNTLEIVLLIASFVVLFAGILYANDQVSGDTRDGITVVVIGVMIISTILVVLVVSTEVYARVKSLTTSKVAPSKAAAEESGNEREIELLTSLLPSDGPVLAEKLDTIDDSERHTFFSLLRTMYASDGETRTHHPAPHSSDSSEGSGDVDEEEEGVELVPQKKVRRAPRLRSHIDFDMDVFASHSDTLEAIPDLGNGEHFAGLEDFDTEDFSSDV